MVEKRKNKRKKEKKRKEDSIEEDGSRMDFQEILQQCQPDICLVYGLRIAVSAYV